MRVVPREDLHKDEEIAYTPLQLFEDYPDLNTSWDYIPKEAYPLKVVHSDDEGNLILLLDETDANTTIITDSIQFDFIEEPNDNLSKST